MTSKLKECRERLAKLHMWAEFTSNEYDYFTERFDLYVRRLVEVDSEDVEKVMEIKDTIAEIVQSLDEIEKDMLELDPKLFETYKEFLTLLEQEYDDISEEEHPELFTRTKAEIREELKELDIEEFGKNNIVH